MSSVPEYLPSPSVRRHRLRVVGLLAVLVPLVVCTAMSNAEETRHPVGDPKKAAEAAVPGSFVIVGGGGLPLSVRTRFLELAGGKNARLVIIPTASEFGHLKGVFASYEFWKTQPASTVTLLHTMDRAKADDPAFVKPLTEATGVWMGGGDQARLTAAYRGTSVVRELRNLIARGGVIGGTSAGASAMSSLMIVSGNPIAKVGGGLELVDEMVIDQHFHNRNRMKRLQGILERYPTYVGLGIDEETAVVLQGRKAKIIGNANVRICLPAPIGKLPAVQVFKDGDEVDLSAHCLAVRPVKKAAVVVSEKAATKLVTMPGDKLLDEKSTSMDREK